MSIQIPHVRYYLLQPHDYWRTINDTVEFWDGDRWRPSILPNRLAFFDDALGGGGTLQEIQPPYLPDTLKAYLGRRETHE